MAANIGQCEGKHCPIIGPTEGHVATTCG